MNRKKGIIIGTTGIIIVTLALIGFTYGFYLSLISGNETSKKVKVTAGKSKLEYVELSSEVDTIIGPGYTNTKYFAVQNVGDISASYYIYLVDVTNTFNRKNDIVYTIYRKAYDYSETNTEPESFDINASYDFSEWENITNSHCKTVSEFTDYGDCQYPAEKSELSTQKQTIMDKNDYYVYAFVVTYINQPDVDQIDDEESVFSGKIKIYADETGTNVSPYEDGTLADAIVENAIANKNGTIYRETPLTTPGVEVSGENEATLSLTTDDYGPSYYFRGNVENNYLNFSGMCWRIVRIQGDESIKIVLTDSAAVCSIETLDNTRNSIIDNTVYGYDSETIAGAMLSDYKNSISDSASLRKALNDWFNGTKADSSIRFNEHLKTNIIKNDNFCLGELSKAYDYNSGILLDNDANSNIGSGINFYYDSGKRLLGLNEIFEPSLKCGTNSEVDTNQIGILTADEIIFSGGKAGEFQSNYYLYNSEIEWWTLTTIKNIDKIDYVITVNVGQEIELNDRVDDTNDIRPSLTLVKGVKYMTGNGTKEQPYTIDESE